MIRNVVLAKLKTGYDTAEVESIQEGLRNLNCPGTRNYTVGTDAGLRDGNWDFVIVADFEDTAAYRGYDEDAEHNRLRARLAPFIDQVARAQFELPDS
ncbi:MAG TPA: Dabb family protein [Mycobacterium sp.]